MDLDHPKSAVVNGASLVRSEIKFGFKCIDLVLDVVSHMGHIGECFSVGLLLVVLSVDW